MVLVRNEIQVKRVDCSIPNVCIVDVNLEEDVRIMGVYAPYSRSWNLQNLSTFVSDNCVIFGDFNVDLEQDGNKAESLLDWADSLNLSPFVPACPTSLRSDRTIDYALSNIANIGIQKFNTNTTSDHYPVLSILPMKCKQRINGKSIHWKVFNLFTEYTFSYWEKSWCFQNFDVAYDDYIKFLHCLIARCTVSFPLNKYRLAVPPYLRCFMSYVRALSFRQSQTNDNDLKKQVYYLRKQIKYELKLFVSSKLTLASSSGAMVKNSLEMCDLAANFYEDFFRKSENIVRPHPYVDAHGLNSYMFNFLHSSHWSFLLNLYNLSFSSFFLPISWKDTRIVLLAKNDSVCIPAQTRPISLLDCFQKIGEKLFLVRFRDVLYRRGLLPDNQSGFREKIQIAN